MHICTLGGQQIPRSSVYSFRVDAIHCKVDAAQVLFEGLVPRDPGAASPPGAAKRLPDNGLLCVSLVW